MATNDFIGFASNGSANIMSQADYAAAAEQGDGVQPGMASSKLANKIWRQGANMAAAIGSMIAALGYNALDNGDIAALQSSITSGLNDLANAAAVSGSWTPVFTPVSGGAASLTVSNLAATYTKIGNFVMCYIACDLQASSSASGALRIECSSLPYQHKNDFAVGRMIASGINAVLIPYISNNRLYYTNLTTNTNLQSTDFTTAIPIKAFFGYWEG